MEKKNLSPNVNEIKYIPKDSESRAIGSRAINLVRYQFNSDFWEAREATGADRGTDLIMELVENEGWTHNLIYCQVKGTKEIGRYLLMSGNEFSYPIKKSVINYALNCSNAFLLFLVDNVNQIVYYQSIQDYFMKHPERFDALETSGNPDSTINIRILKSNIVSDDDTDLKELAKCTYFRKSARDIEKKSKNKIEVNV